MKTKIEDLESLQSEIALLKRKKEELKARLLEDVQSIKEELKPVNLVVETIADAAGVHLDREKFHGDNFMEGIKSVASQVLSKTGAKIESRVYEVAGKVLNGIEAILERVRKSG